MESRGGAPRPGGAFTLIEILIAFGLLLVFFVGVFTIVSRFSKAGNIGQWRSTSASQLRKAQERVRQNIEGASYPMLITPQANSLAAIPDHYLIVNPEGSAASDDNETETVRVFGPDTGTADPGDADEVVLQLVRSRPGREGLGSVGNLSDKPVEATRVQFVLRKSNPIFNSDERKFNRQLFLVQEANSVQPGAFNAAAVFPFAGGEKTESLIVTDVNRVRVSVQSDSLESGGSTTRPALVQVQIICVEPSAGKTEQISTVRALPNAGVEVR